MRAALAGVILLAGSLGHRAAASITPAWVAGAGSHTCPDGKQVCLDGQPCCRFDSSGDGCCSGGNTEACCADDKGGVCCVSQPTVCVSVSAAYPARCCPRETVGCTGGTVGCCNPARAWQRGPPLNPPAALRTPGRGLLGRAKFAKVSTEKIAASSSPPTFASKVDVAYALFVGGFSSQLEARVINVTSGEVVSKATVSGYNNWGESTRDFLWDSERKVFYALDVNFTKYPTRPAGGRPILLSTIDPTTGAITVMEVSGATDYVTGYSMHSSGRIHAASEKWSDDGKTVEGWHYFWVEPSKGVASTIAVLDRDVSKESDPAFYGGYHRSTDGSGTGAYRVGFLSVEQQTGPGVGIVSLSEADGTAKASWVNVESPEGHGYFLGALPAGADGSFLSLAPDSQTGFLSLFQWSVAQTQTGGAPVQIPLGNVTGPRVMGGGTLGFTLDAVQLTSDGGSYVALVDVPSNVPVPFPGAWDAWALAHVDLSTKQASIVPLNPGMLEGSNSISGLGL